MTDPSSPRPGEIVVPLHVEDISIDHRITERNVRVSIHTTSHDHLIDEAVDHERVEIERVAINRPVNAVPPVRQEGDTTVISVVEEVVVVERRLVLKEEIHLRRVRITERHHETVTLRAQHVAIERAEPGASLSALPSEMAPIPKPQAIKDETA
jgi:stress response protein YsnF